MEPCYQDMHVYWTLGCALVRSSPFREYDILLWLELFEGMRRRYIRSFYPYQLPDCRRRCVYQYKVCPQPLGIFEIGQLIALNCAWLVEPVSSQAPYLSDFMADVRECICVVHACFSHF